jgi:hypothetical protein
MWCAVPLLAQDRAFAVHPLVTIVEHLDAIWHKSKELGRLQKVAIGQVYAYAEVSSL